MTLTVSDLGPGRVITWDRQARRNAWDLETMAALAAAIEAAAADESVRCIVLRGAGEHFSAGDDLQSALEATRETWAQTIEAFQRLTRAVLAAPPPVLCAIDGWCVGGACEFTASCDLRICTDRAKLLTPEVRIGLVFTNGGSIFLPHLLGEARARELLLTGEPRDAEWARSAGFVNEVVAPSALNDAIERWVGSFEHTSRAAVAATKQLLNLRFGSLLEESMQRETQQCVELFDHPDCRAALDAFRERSRS
jgi:2-(1,2-epoxy-1,2-dihydrophenyl)acetyl-CoA isomerase